jgi:survival-of-motor-neuron-related-splicing factor 30
LETVQLGLQADPDSAELQELKTELEQVISLTEATIAELKPASVQAVVPKKLVEPVKEKWSRENHPAFKKTTAAEEAETTTTFKVNDMVLAKWHSGDKGFYPARITSITGSSTSPVYIVKFKNYDTTETLRAKDIKPIVNANKRKADGTPVVASIPPPPPVSSNVISAAADINPELAQQTKREPSKVSDGPVRPAKVPKKIKANKELEAGKSKWQDFAQKGKFGKAAKKDSMFRTPEGVHGRGKKSTFHAR